MPEEVEREFLQEKFGSDARIAVMRPGEWSTVYSVQTPKADLVVRFNVYDEDFEKDAYAIRWSSAALPIPPIIEWGPALGRFYAVSDRVRGEHIDEVDEIRMRRLLPALFAALDAMRTVDLSEATGFGGWRADGRTSHRSWREGSSASRQIQRPAGRLAGESSWPRDRMRWRRTRRATKGSAS